MKYCACLRNVLGPNLEVFDLVNLWLSECLPQIGHCRSDRGTQKLHDGPCRTCDGQLEWMCRDNTCVNMTQLCDGHVDCADGSDETWCSFTCRDGQNIAMDKYVIIYYLWLQTAGT